MQPRPGGPATARGTQADHAQALKLARARMREQHSLVSWAHTGPMPSELMPAPCQWAPSREAVSCAQNRGAGGHVPRGHAAQGARTRDRAVRRGGTVRMARRLSISAAVAIAAFDESAIVV